MHQEMHGRDMQNMAAAGQQRHQVNILDTPMSNNYNQASGFLQVAEGEDNDESQTQSQLQSLGVTPQGMRNSERVTDNSQLNQNASDDNQLNSTPEEQKQDGEQKVAETNERYTLEQDKSSQELIAIEEVSNKSEEVVADAVEIKSEEGIEK